jgi:hypothetical protein
MRKSRAGRYSSPHRNPALTPSDMKRSTFLLTLALSAAALPLQALAHDDHGHGRHHHKPGHKEVFWDGPCKVERKYQKHGKVKEKRECRPDVVYVQPQPHVHHAPQPVVVHPVVVQPGVVIHGSGTVRLP